MKTKLISDMSLGLVTLCLGLAFPAASVLAIGVDPAWAIDPAHLLKQRPVGRPNAKLMSGPTWQWVVEMAHPATADRSHIHAGSWDTDGSFAHSFLGCEYTQGNSFAAIFAGGGANATTFKMPSNNSQSQVYGIRGRSAAGVVSSNIGWQAAAWFYNNAGWSAPTILHQSIWAKSMATDVDGYRYGGGTDTACGSVVKKVPQGQEVPGLWNCSTSAWTALPYEEKTFKGGRCSAIDGHWVVGSLFLTGQGSPPHAIKWGDRAMNKDSAQDLHPGPNFAASMALDTFGFRTVGVVGNWQSQGDDAVHGYRGWISAGRAALWDYSNQFCNLHSNAYTATRANAISGNAVVGCGTTGSGANGMQKALYWSLATSNATPLPIELPSPLKPNGTPYRHAEAWDVVAGGDFVVGVAFDNRSVDGTPTDERAVIWRLAFQ